MFSWAKKVSDFIQKYCSVSTKKLPKMSVIKMEKKTMEFYIGKARTATEKDGTLHTDL